MAQNAVLARMEAMCIEVMEMSEIFLVDDDDEADAEADEGDTLSENLDADEDDREDGEHIPEAADNQMDDDDKAEKENADDETAGGKNKRTEKPDAEQEKGISGKQKRNAKWISRALRAAVNPIASRFNLNLKVNLDLNVANKSNKAAAKIDPKSNDESTSSSANTKPKKSPQQQQRRADLARIKDLEEENRYLEKVFKKIVPAYADLKTKHSEKTKELEEHQSKTLERESQIKQLLEEQEKIKTKLECQITMQHQLENEKSQAQTQILSLQRELDALKKENTKKISDIEELHSNLAELQKNHQIASEKEQTRFKCILNEKQSIIQSSEEQLQKLKESIQELQDCKTTLEAELQQFELDYNNLQTQMERRCWNLLQQNRELNELISKGIPSQNSTTVQLTQSTKNECPICKSCFKNVGDLTIHAENCGS